jgi:hypothetical protein
MLFVRPGKSVIVDQVAAPPGRPMPEVQWLLQLPKAPTVQGSSFWTANAASWLRCRPLLPGGSLPETEATAVNTYRVSLRYRADNTLQMVQFIEVGDGQSPGEPEAAATRITQRGIEVSVAGSTYEFSTQDPFGVSLSQ